MAVVFEGFSIREYASKMRSVNVSSKCWPFDDDDDDEQLLPPITFKKYRWWRNEFDETPVKKSISDEDHDHDDKPPVLQVSIPLSGFEKEEKQQLVDLGIGKVSRKKQMVSSSNVVVKKSKILKKRSILEIFAVAPEIETKSISKGGKNKIKIKNKNKNKKNKKKKKNNGSVDADADADGGGGGDKLNLKKERHQKRKEQGDVYDPICLSDMESDDVWIIEKEDPSLPQDQSCMDSYECIDVEENRTKVKRGTHDFDDAVDPISLSDMESDDLLIIEKENPSLPQDPALLDIEGNFADVEPVEERKRKRKERVQELDLDEETRHQNAKEKCRKPRVPVPVSPITRIKGLLFNKKLRKQITNDVAMLKKKPSSKKSLSKQNKLNVIQASKLVAKRQQQEPPVFSVHSILKSQTRVISSQKPSDCLLSDQTKLCLVEQSERHVSFSGKDDIIGPTKECGSSFELARSQCLQKVISDIVDNALVSQLSEDSDEDIPKDEIPEVNGSEKEIVISIASEAGVQSTNEKELLDEENDHASVSTFVSANNNSCQDKGKCFSDESVDLMPASQHHHDFQLFSQGKSYSLYNHPYASIPRVTDSTKGGLSSSVEIQAGGYQEANDRGKSLPDPFVTSLPRSAATSSFQNIREAMQPSASSLMTSIEPNVRHQFLPRSSMHSTNDCALEYQPSCQLSPKGLMSSISSSVEWKQGASMCRNKAIDDGIFGLPLNSQGELIQFHSSSKLGYNHLKKQDIMMGSSSTMPIHKHMWPNTMAQTSMKQKHHVDGTNPEDNLKLFPGTTCFTQNPIPLPARLGVTEMQGTRQTDVHWQDSLRGNNNSIHQLGSDLNVMKLSSHGCRPCSLALNQNENGKKPADILKCGFLPPNQPTMRLMGKDVTVGRSSNQENQCFEDGERIWTDKEIITEHYPTMSTAPVSANSPLYRHSQPEWVIQPVSRKAKGIVTPSGAQINTISPNFLQRRAVDPRPAHSIPDWQTYALSQSGIPSVNRDNCQDLQPFANPLDSQLWTNRTSKVLESGISEIVYSKMGSEIPLPVPAPAPSPHNSCDLRLFNTQLKSKKSLETQETASSFMFPFSGQDFPENVQPSWSQRSSYCLPQWLLSATLQQEVSPTTSQHYSDTNATYQPCSVSGAGFVAIPSPYHNSMIPYSHYPSNTFPRVRSSSSSSSFGHPPLMPVPPGFRRTFPVNTGCKKGVKVDGTKGKDYHFNHLGHVKKARKRPAAIADDSARPLKKLNCGMHDSSSLMGFNSGANFDVYMQYNTGTPVLDAYMNNGSSGVGFSPMEFQRDGLANSLGTVFPNDIVGRSGPIKLSAGAKHILKPNQNIDQVDYRLTHSAIPVGAVTNSSKVSGFQKTPAQIYRF